MYVEKVTVCPNYSEKNVLNVYYLNFNHSKYKLTGDIFGKLTVGDT